MTTSAPSSANRTATARPIRFAAPVTSATRPCNGAPDLAIFPSNTNLRLYYIRVQQTSPPVLPLFRSTLPRTDKNVPPTLQSHYAGGLMHLDLLAIAAHPD